MRYLIALIFALFSHACFSQQWEDRQVFNSGATGASLKIISSTDTDLFYPFIESYVASNPTVSIEYLVTGTADIDRRFRANPSDFDIVISSAMDLQLKLTNDGFAQPVTGLQHPDWAQWRQSLFAFTSEPAAIVLNKKTFASHPIPNSRQELIQALRARPETFYGRVATYDIRQSGLGYLFATQDARASETFWRLMEVMGSLNVRLYCCSGEMIDDLAEGKIAVAYNVLGSYAAARDDYKDKLEIVLPSDFPTTMMRTAFVSRQAPNPATAKAFVQHLIALQSSFDATRFLLPPLNSERNAFKRSTIVLEPALMTFLDELKRKKFLAEWEDAVIQSSR